MSGCEEKLAYMVVRASTDTHLEVWYYYFTGS